MSLLALFAVIFILSRFFGHAHRSSGIGTAVAGILLVAFLCSREAKIIFGIIIAAVLIGFAIRVVAGRYQNRSRVDVYVHHDEWR